MGGWVNERRIKEETKKNQIKTFAILIQRSLADNRGLPACSSVGLAGRLVGLFDEKHFCKLAFVLKADGWISVWVKVWIILQC